MQVPGKIVVCGETRTMWRRYRIQVELVQAGSVLVPLVYFHSSRFGPRSRCFPYLVLRYGTTAALSPWIIMAARVDSSPPAAPQDAADCLIGLEGPRPRLGEGDRQFVIQVLTWLILPVVIRLSQRLSHACLSINELIVKPRTAH